MIGSCTISVTVTEQNIKYALSSYYFPQTDSVNKILQCNTTTATRAVHGIYTVN